MSLENVIAELKDMYRWTQKEPASERSCLDNATIQRWCDQLNLTRGALYDAIALRLALGFLDNEFPFELCDAIVNDIHSVITLGDANWPELFWRVFLAFDAGEYRHQNDGGDVDPVEKYTRPQIAEIVKAQRT